MLAFVSRGLAAPSVATKPAPAWIVPVTPSGKAPNPKEYADGYYVAFYDKQVNMELRSTYFRTIRQITTESGVQNGSEISVLFDPAYERVDFHSITIWRGDKPIQQMKSTEFKVLPLETDRQRFIYNGSYTASVILKDIRKGDRIEYSYSLTGSNPVFLNKYSGMLSFGVQDYVSHIHYAVIAPQSRKLFFKDFNQPPHKTIRQNGSHTIYEWELKNVKGVPYEEYTPSWFNSDPFVQITEFSSWQEVVDWGLELYQVPPVTGALRSKVDQWIKQSNGSENAYIEEALRFVQDEIRYLGIETGENSHRPHRPEDVFRQRYGDCKDKVLLLCALLRANQIECDPLLVDTYKAHHLSDYLPSPLDFNHVVVRMRTRDENVVYLDATLSLQGGTTSRFYFPPYGKGLLIKPGQKALMDLPFQNEGYLTVNEEFTVPAPSEKTNQAALLVRSIYYGSEADNIRQWMQQRSMAETEESYLNYYRDIYKHAQLESLDTLEYYDQRQANNFSLMERYGIQNIWQYDSTRKKYHFSLLGKGLYDHLVVLPNRPRKSPVALKFPFRMQYTIQLRMPSYLNFQVGQWTVERESYIIRYDSRFSEKDQVWELYYEMNTLKDHVSADHIEQYKQDIERLSQTLEHQVTNTDTSLTQADNVNGWMILFGLLALISSIGFCFWLYRYSPGSPVETDEGLPLGGWLSILGITVLLKPIVLLASLMDPTMLVYFTNAGWNSLAGEPMLKELSFHLLLIIETLVNALLLSVSVLLIVLYFKKRDSFPRLFSIYVVGSLIFLAVDHLLSQSLLASSPSYFTDEELGDLVRQLIYVAIWVPYLFRSERVKQTFIHTYGAISSTDTSMEPDVIKQEAR